MTIIKKKRGRPTLEAGKALENKLIIRLTALERLALEEKAYKKRLPLSAWARTVLNQAS